MSQNYYLYESQAQDVNSDQTSLVASLMSHPTSINKDTTITSCSSSTRTTHSIKNSHNYNDNNISNGSSNNTNTTHKKSLINPALVKRKYYSKREPIFFFIMRLNLKAVLLLLTVAVVVITCAVYMRCAEFTFPHDLVKRWDRKLYAVGGNSDLLNNNLGEGGGGGGLVDGDVSDLTPLQDIECLINQEYTIRCKRDEEDHEIYVPFSFIRNYFDISGSMSNPSSPQAIEGNNEVQAPAAKFMWMHSTAKINLPKGKYDPRGLFMYFENYNVEVRDRVKCISAADGVPISTQWEKRGYFYPTQIAQFALSHYSKNLTEPEPRIRILENADNVLNTWSIPKGSNLTRKWHPKFNSSVIQYETAIDFDSAITLNNIDQTLDLVLNIDLLLITNSSSLMVTVENHETKRTYRVHYIPADLLLSVQDENIYYGLSVQALNKWRHLTRDLHIDVQKGLAMESPKKSGIKIKRSELRIVSISLMGIGFFDNITLSTYNHLAHFYDAAEWFVNNQDLRTGGWPNPVRRSLNGFAELRSGWLSAMGQGHAISVLARAYWHSGGDKRYLKAASLGLKPYRVLSKDGGVLAQFMDKYYWYEEYPTTPASFVLNGFIYSLLGLYDLNSTAPSNIANEAGKLFNQGMISLKKMLLLYDTGSGTSYDLRHLSLGVAPNLARWDYHATHVNQLLLLATIDSDPIISQTAERWKGYMFGKRAKHN
ncbi:D-glucuronyl C5-epimerase B isoform X1 [Lucilia cuprina]|uniref:D-glucuronyl C5-epimerase B isoform X1 n=1 Tax=Lucilia cuprina TaxID=7375 RepID=UPI001F06607A|nr:D-glucuronyl C5-epimerase B isoform X1 [Lucilia cuprina]